MYGRRRFTANYDAGSEGTVIETVTATMGCNYAEWDVKIAVKYRKEPYTPAKIMGPPEKCHPEEGGEIEILDASIKDGLTMKSHNIEGLIDAIQTSVDCAGFWHDVIVENHNKSCERRAEAEAEAYMEAMVS